MTFIRLLDINTGIIHTLEVSKEDAQRANEDLLFATELLHSHQAFLAQQQVQHVVEPGSISSNNNIRPITRPDIQDSSIEESSNFSSEEEKGVFHWPHEAILLLITLYAEHEHQIKSGKISIKKFWNIISLEVNKKGYSVTDVQCKSKMAGMKNTYKSIKDHNAKSGNNNRKWQYFDIMDKQFNDKPWITPVLTLDSNDPPPLSEITNIGHENEVRLPVNLKCLSNVNIIIGIKQFALLEKVIAATEENTIQRQKIHEEAMVCQNRLLDILEKMITK